MTIALPIEGACMCRRVRIRVSKPPILTGACHCTGCQKMSASAFSLSAVVPVDGFEAEGETQIGALHGKAANYVHCAYCLNWVWTAPNGFPFVNLRPTMFDVPEWSTPFIELHVSERLPWARTTARHSFEKLVPPELYGQLMAEYAAWSASIVGS